MSLSKKSLEALLSGLLLFLSVNAVLYGYWQTTAAVSFSDGLDRNVGVGGSVALVDPVHQTLVGKDTTDDFDSTLTARSFRLRDGTINLSMVVEDERILLGRPSSCYRSVLRSDVRMCLDHFMPECRSMTTCLKPVDAVRPSTSSSAAENRTIGSGGGDASAAGLELETKHHHIPSVGGDEDADDRALVETAPQAREATSVALKITTAVTQIGPRQPYRPPEFSFNESVLGRLMAQRMHDGRHKRIHYYCGSRDRLAEWNITFFTTQRICSSLNAREEERADELEVASRLERATRQSAAIRNNATRRHELFRKWTDDATTRRIGLLANCSLWLALVERWSACAERSLPLAPQLTQAAKNASRFLRGCGLDGEQGEGSEKGVSSTQRLGAEVLLALTWADSAAPHMRDADDDGADAFGRWAKSSAAYETMLWGFVNGSVVAEHNLFSLTREAYARWRQDLREQKSIEDANGEEEVLGAWLLNQSTLDSASLDARAADALLDVPAPTLPSQDDPDDMLRFPPQLHLGCASKEFSEVRVAFVGDSLSVAYPRRVASWLRSLCAYCDEATVKIHVYNFAVSQQHLQSYPKTGMFEKSLRYEPDVVVVMLGTNDAIWYWEFDEARFEAQLEELLEKYLQAGARRVLVVTPPPVFDAVLVNRTRKGSKRHRAKTYERRAGYVAGDVARCVGDGMVPATRRVVRRMQTHAVAAHHGARLILVDLFHLVNEWILRQAARFYMSSSNNSSTSSAEVVVAGEHNAALRGRRDEATTGLSSWHHPGVPAKGMVRRTTKKIGSPIVVNHSSGGGSLPSDDGERSLSSFLHHESVLVDSQVFRHRVPKSFQQFPLYSQHVQRAIFTGLADGVHLEKPLQKVVAVEVLRQLFMREWEA